MSATHFEQRSLAVVESRLDSQDRALAELRSDLKEVLAATTATNLAVVQLPKWEDVRTLHAAVAARVASLEATRDQQTGGWKVLAAIGTVIAAIGGWVGSLFTR